MATRPNQQTHDIATIRRRSNEENTMIADDIQADGSATIISAPCATCNAYQQERVTIPNSVIMDELVEPTDPNRSGEKLAQLVARDDRITARTSANPIPHEPSSKWGARHVMQRAIDMKNSRLIPFSPFHANIDNDGLRDREVFTEWRDRYLAEVPSSSRFAGEPAEASDQTDGSALPAIEETEGREMTIDPDSPLVDEVPSGRDDVLKWVGQDRERALAASWVEGQRTNGRRKTVDSHLISLIGE